jgi:hypothetical protein
MRQNDGVGQISDVYLASRPSPALPLDYPVWFPLCRLSVYRVEQPRCHTATYGVPLSKAYEMDCQRRSGDPTWVMLQSLNKRQAPCPKLPTFPHVIDLDRYDESPAAACVALGISQPKLTKLIREAKVRSINIGRTRLIEKAADVRRMATAAR